MDPLLGERSTAEKHVSEVSVLVRGKYVVTDPSQEDAFIENGAVAIASDRIVDVGKYDRVKALHPFDEEIGSDRFVVLPGLVNAHEHGRGLSAIQLGVADSFLERWTLDLLGLRPVSTYLTTMYAAAQFIESGVTTVLHHYYCADAASYESELRETVRGYRDAGLRAVIALGIMDASPVSKLLGALAPTLPPDLQLLVRDFRSRRSHMLLDEYLPLFRHWRRECNDDPASRVKVMLGPVSVHWCSDALLTRIREEAEATQTGIQAHVLETAYQRRDAIQQHGTTAIDHLRAISFLCPLLSCAHMVWATERDIELLAETGTSVVHNPSSNLRLRSGIAPINVMLQKGVNVALGIDSNGLNDDGDMLQEMRLAANLHRVPGVWHHPTENQVLAMATKSGARALTLDNAIGVIERDKRADLILVNVDELPGSLPSSWADWSKMIVHRAKAQDVDTVIIDGRVVLRDHRLLCMDKQALVAELRSELAKTGTARRPQVNDLARRLGPFVDGLYQADPIRVASAHYVYNMRE